MLRFLSLVVILTGCLVSAEVQAAPRIAAIEVKGDGSVSESTIQGVIGSRVGSSFDSDQVANDIRALYQLGLFSDLHVEKRETARGLVLVYVYEGSKRIDSIVFEGNKHFDDDDLLAEVDVKPFTAADPSKIRQSIQKIREKYAAKGYHLVTIRHRFEKVPDTQNEKLIFTMEEHEGIRVKRIHFVGNKAFSDDELRKVIRTRQKGYFSWLSGSGKYSQEILERDAAFLAYHYLNHGYVRVQVSPPEVYLTRDRKWLMIHFHVEEGKQYRVGEIDVVGDILTTKEELIGMIHLQPGDIYSRRQIDEDIQDMVELYGNEAYAFANINSHTVPNDEDLTTKVVILIGKAAKIKIEQINISGNTTTRDKVIRRELEVVENSYYHEGRLRRSREKLMALGYFEEVNFSTPRGSTDDRLILNIRVKEKPTGTFSIGAGFSSVENFILTASISKENFFGYGISGSFSLEFSSRRQLFLLSFQDPYFLDTPWIFGASGFRTVNVFEDFDRRSFGGSLTLGRRLFDYSQVLVGYSIEDVEAGDFNTTIPAPFQDNLSGLTSSLSLTLSRDTRDNRLYPTKGLYLSVGNEFAGAGGDNMFYRVIGNARYYHPVVWKLIWKNNFTMGYIKSFDDNPVPLFERFFTGGINSLRGYQLHSLGPAVRVTSGPTGVDSEFVIGGNKLMLLNTELEFPLYEPAGFKIVAFFDAGNAFAEDENFDPLDLRLDYGFGMRWNSPFGPMRFEWGIPINRRADEDSVVFNFSIGSFF